MKNRWFMAVVAASLMTAGPAAAQSSLQGPLRSPLSAPSPGAAPRPASGSPAR